MSDTLPLSVQVRLEEVCTRFEEAWQAAGPAGVPPSLEHYVGEVPDAARLALWRELVRLDVHYRRARGESVGTDGYAARCPGGEEAGRAIVAVLAAAPTMADPDGLGRFRATPGCDLPAIPGYQLLGVLGDGGMGIVYRARHLALKREVALKVLRSESRPTDEELSRFRIEAEALARLQHPNIVPVYEVGAHEGRPFFAMEYCAGGSLDARLKEGLPDPRWVAERVEALARAMHAVHGCQIVHRDLKPANVLLAADGTPKVGDFGLARKLDDDDHPTPNTRVMGTPGYTAPEVAVGGAARATPLADVYALGAILYECLTGRPPFMAATFWETLRQVGSEEPAAPRVLNPAVPADLETICLKCLRKEPESRYGSAEALADDLRRFLDGRPVLARPVGSCERLLRWARRNPAVAALAAAVAVLLIALAAGGTASALWMHDKRDQAIEAKQAADAASLRAKRDLFQSRFDQARAEHWAGQAGGRDRALRALAEAARLARELDLPREQLLGLRNEAIACLVLPDLTPAKEWDGYPEGSAGVVFDAALERYARSDDHGNVSVRRVDGDAELTRLTGLGRAAWSLRFSPDGQFLAAMADHHRAVVWHIDTGRVAVKAPAGSMDFRPDGRQIAIAQPDGTIALFELPSGREVRRLRKTAAPVSALAFSPGGDRLAVCEMQDGSGVEIRDPGKDEVVTTLPVPQARAAAWQPDGELLAVACGDNRIHLWDVRAEGGRYFGRLEGHESAVTEVAFNHAGTLLVSTGWDGTTRLWEPFTRRQILSTPTGFPEGWPKYVFSPDDRRLSFSRRAGTKLGLWDVAAGGTCRVLPNHRAKGPATWSVSLDPAGRLLASADDDGARLWDCSRPAELAHLPGTEGSQAALLDPRSGALLVRGDLGLQCWPVREEGEGEGRTVRLGPPATLVRPAPTRPSSHTAALSTESGRVAVCDRARGQVLLTPLDGGPPVELPGHAHLAFVALSPDARWVATGTWGGSPAGVRVSDSETRDVVWTLLDGSHLGCFSPDGKRLATLGHDCRLWEVGTWRIDRVLPKDPSQSRAKAAAFSPDGSVLAVGYHSRVIRLVSPSTGQEFATLAHHHRAEPSVLAFNGDGGVLAVGNTNHEIQVWDLRQIRANLAEMGLDWDVPAYDPAPPAPPPAGRVEVIP
jgi:WD40 repeat protein